MSSIGSGSTTVQDADDNSDFRRSPVRSAHFDAMSPLLSPTHTHVDTASDAVTSFFKKIVHRVRRPSLPHCRETDTGSDTTQNVHPFAFKPLQLASMVDSKSLETLESMGGVDALLRGLGTHPTHGLSTEPGLGHIASPDPTLQSFTMSHATEKDPPKPDVMTTSSAGEPQGLQNTVSLGGDVPAEVQSSEEVYRTSIKDRQRIFGRNVLPRLPSKSLLQLMWFELKDKVLVSSN
jgi:Ca2+-transporting ATPase